MGMEGEAQTSRQSRSVGLARCGLQATMLLRSGAEHWLSTGQTTWAERLGMGRRRRVGWRRNVRMHSSLSGCTALTMRPLPSPSAGSTCRLAVGSRGSAGDDADPPPLLLLLLLPLAEAAVVAAPADDDGSTRVEADMTWRAAAARAAAATADDGAGKDLAVLDVAARGLELELRAAGAGGGGGGSADAAAAAAAASFRARATATSKALVRVGAMRGKGGGGALVDASTLAAAGARRA